MDHPIVIFANQRTGSSRMAEWVEHSYVGCDFKKLDIAIEKLGYSLSIANSNELLDATVGRYGCVLREYANDKDLNKAEEAIDIILSYKPIIKIMTEFTPLEILEIILKKIDKYGYKSMLLYREDERARILSKIIMDLDHIKSTGSYPTVENLTEEINKGNSNLLSLSNLHCISYESVYVRKDIITEFLLTKITGKTDFENLRKKRLSKPLLDSPSQKLLDQKIEDALKNKKKG